MGTLYTNSIWGAIQRADGCRRTSQPSCHPTPDSDRHDPGNVTCKGILQREVRLDFWEQSDFTQKNARLCSCTLVFLD